MSAAEMILIVIGVAIFLLGYLMPARKKDLDEEVRLISEDEVRKMVAGEMEHVKGKISDIVDETVNYSIEKAERAMERVTNEKVMAVSEYSDTVLEEINKNHKEVVFLYDMLNDKHDNLMSTINEATMAADSVKETTKDSEIMAHEAAEKIETILQISEDAAVSIKDAENAAVKVQKAAQESMRIVIRAVENAKSELAALRAAKAEYMAETEKEQPVELSQVQKRVMADAEQKPTAAVPWAESETGMSDLQEESADEYSQNAVDTKAFDRSEILTKVEKNGSRREEAVQSYPDSAATETVTGYQREAVMSGEAFDNPADFDRSNVLQRGVQPRVSDQEFTWAAELEKPVDERYTEPVTNGRFGRPAPDYVPDQQEETVEEQVDFKPISPRRVEIIHEPDGDYVADDTDDMSTSEAFASMGFFAPREETKRRPKTRKATRRERPQDAAPSVDLQFAQGKENGRNSNERILELHKAGKSNMAIARELGLGLGEVKLVIDLFEGM